MWQKSISGRMQAALLESGEGIPLDGGHARRILRFESQIKSLS